MGPRLPSVNGAGKSCAQLNAAVVIPLFAGKVTTTRSTPAVFRTEKLFWSHKQLFTSADTGVVARRGTHCESLVVQRFRSMGSQPAALQGTEEVLSAGASSSAPAAGQNPGGTSEPHKGRHGGALVAARSPRRLHAPQTRVEQSPGWTYEARLSPQPLSCR